MSKNMKPTLWSGIGLLAAILIYVVSSDVIWSLVALLIGISVGRAAGRTGPGETTEEEPNRSSSMSR